MYSSLERLNLSRAAAAAASSALRLSSSSARAFAFSMASFSISARRSAMSDSRLAWNAASSARALARCAGKSFIWPRQKSACVRTFDLSNPSFALARRLRSSLSPSSPPAICAAFATVRS